MKQLHINLKKGEVKVLAENKDDLWYLSHMIDPKDFVKGKTLRKIKIGESTERAVKIIKKPVFMKIEVEKIEFGKDAQSLRASGKIVEGPEDIPRGSYHTFDIAENTTITIIKEKWPRHQIEKLKEACTGKPPKILICVFDREEAFFAQLKIYGYEILSHIKGVVQKKALDERLKDTFYAEIIKKIEEYYKRHGLERVILASPAFFKEDLLKQIKNEELKRKIILATCSSVRKPAIDEVLKRDETKQALHQDRVSKETRLVERILTEISRNGPVAYGFKETKEASEAGAVEILLVTDYFIQQTREKNSYGALDNLMKSTDSSNGSVHIISSEHDAGKKLDGLGGVAAILRYKLKY